MAMPWSIAKAKRAKILSSAEERKRLTALFDACFRIQREACEAAGHHIPMIVENVRGAQEWVGRSRWAYGSFNLWGDVPALMPIAKSFCGMKNTGGSWFGIDPQGNKVMPNNGRDNYGIKAPGMFSDPNSTCRRHGSKSKAASAMIAKIPLPLSSYIARTFKPT